MTSSEDRRNSDRELILDTLLWRGEPSGPSGTCFVTSVAGVDLIKSDASLLPAIERVLDEVVVPELTTGDASGSRLRGLAYVLCAYSFIGMRAAPQRVISFLLSRSRHLLRETIECIPIGYQWTKEGYNFGAPPNSDLRDFLAGVASGGDEELRSVALRALKQLDECEMRRRKHEHREAKRESGEGTSTDSHGRLHRRARGGSGNGGAKC